MKTRSIIKPSKDPIELVHQAIAMYKQLTGRAPTEEEKARLMAKARRLASGKK